MGSWTWRMCSSVIFRKMWLRNDTQFFFIVLFLYMNIIFIARWLFCGNSQIWLCSDVFACRQKLCKPDSIFKQTRVNFFYRKNMTSFLNYVTATLRTLFAWRGPFLNGKMRLDEEKSLYAYLPGSHVGWRPVHWPLMSHVRVSAPFKVNPRLQI